MKKITVKQTFWTGLILALLGGGFIWLGDGGDSLFCKGIVVSGVVLTVGGIGMLRYLLFANKKQVNGRQP